ncbi:MAG: hypothetical protein IJZ72_06430 [Oscillospiraceae bacterium]|nr:hypothetical protein [Oscillospiraceae bacterium]
MKRLKLKQPFRGYEDRVLTIAVIISPCAGLAALSLSEDKKVSFVFPFILIAFVMILTAAYLILKQTNAEEQYLIEQAKEYDWQSPDDWVYKAVRDKYKMPWLEISIVSIMLAIFLIAFAVKSESLKAALLPMAVGGGIILLWIILSAVQKKRWSAIDENAECTILRSHHTYTVKTHGRGRTYINEYYVFYTPEGRIVLKKERANCQKVCVVKFNGMITYVEYADKRNYNYSSL